MNTPISQPATLNLQLLPDEILGRIFSWLVQPKHFARSCKIFYAIAADTQARRDHFFHRYGTAALVQVYFRRSHQATPDLAKLLIRSGAVVPRFFVQHVLAKHRFAVGTPEAVFDSSTSGARTTHTTATETPPADRWFAFCAELLKAGRALYGDGNWIQSNDVELFEQLTNDLQENLEEVKTLVTKYHFIPLEDITSAGVFRLYQISRNDLGLIQYMIDYNGLDIRRSNDRIMNWVLNNQEVDAKQIKIYLKLGFKISETLLASVLRDRPSADMVRTLRAVIAEDVLQAQAVGVIANMAGPSGTFIPEVAANLIRMFHLGPTVLDKVILNQVPGNPCETRCYEQQHPEHVWTWALKTYGSRHRYVQAAFRDCIAYIGDLADRATLYNRPCDLPWALPLAFMDAGCRVGPRQIHSIAKAATSPYSCPSPARMLRRITAWVREQNELQRRASAMQKSGHLSAYTHATDNLDLLRGHNSTSDEPLVGVGLGLERYATTGSIDVGSTRTRGRLIDQRRGSVIPRNALSIDLSARVNATAIDNPRLVLDTERRIDWILAIRKEITKNRDFQRALNRADAQWKKLSDMAVPPIEIRRRSISLGETLTDVDIADETPTRFLFEAEVLLKALRNERSSHGAGAESGFSATAAASGNYSYLQVPTVDASRGRLDSGSGGTSGAGKDSHRRKRSMDVFWRKRSQSKGDSPAVDYWNKFVDVVGL